MDHSKNQKLTRRQFIKGAAVVTAVPLVMDVLPFYGTLAHASSEADLVIAKTGSPTKLL
ncbi:MAG: twin-arginine translocation signal domain-containing protein, partial [Deltaproteobacteria bacterium]|nr:twin-arginine translocation signal domain-containing protein [Deltaproteobacteria bacterium]